MKSNPFGFDVVGFVYLSLLGIVAHLIADWLLQNEWMAINKVKLNHPAAWVHSGIHAVFLSLVFGLKVGLFLGLVHLLIDTRVPLTWWGKTLRQTADGPMGIHVAIWRDQVVHIVTVVLTAYLVSR